MAEADAMIDKYITLKEVGGENGGIFKQFARSQGPLILGRASKSDSTAKDRFAPKFRSEKTRVMSNKHAELSWEDDVPMIKDLKSTNGVRIKRENDWHACIPLVAYRIKHGDEIVFGKPIQDPDATAEVMCEPLTVVVSLSDTPLPSVDGPTGLNPKIPTVPLERIITIGDEHSDARQLEDSRPEYEEPTATLWNPIDIGESQASSLGSPSPVRRREETGGSSPTKRGFGMTDADAYMSHDELTSEAEADRKGAVDSELVAKQVADPDQQDDEDGAEDGIDRGNCITVVGPRRKPFQIPCTRAEFWAHRSASAAILCGPIANADHLSGDVKANSIGSTPEAKPADVEMQGTASHLPSPVSSVRSVEQRDGSPPYEVPSAGELGSGDINFEPPEHMRIEVQFAELFGANEAQDIDLSRYRTVSPEPIEPIDTTIALDVAEVRFDDQSADQPEEAELNRVRDGCALVTCETSNFEVHEYPASNPQEVLVLAEPLDGPRSPTGAASPVAAHDGDFVSGNAKEDATPRSHVGLDLDTMATGHCEARSTFEEAAAWQAAAESESGDAFHEDDDAATRIEADCSSSQNGDQVYLDQPTGHIEGIVDSRDRLDPVAATDDVVGTEDTSESKGFVDKIGPIATCDFDLPPFNHVSESDSSEYVQQGSEVTSAQDGRQEDSQAELAQSPGFDIVDEYDGSSFDGMDRAVDSEASGATSEGEDDDEEADDSLEKACSDASSQQSDGESEAEQDDEVSEAEVSGSEVEDYEASQFESPSSTRSSRKRRLDDIYDSSDDDDEVESPVEGTAVLNGEAAAETSTPPKRRRFDLPIKSFSLGLVTGVIGVIAGLSALDSLLTLE